MNAPFLRLRTTEGMDVVLVDEGHGAVKVCLAGDGVRVFGRITKWDARRAAHFLEGDRSEATRPGTDQEVTAVGLRPKLRADTEPGDEF